MLANDNVPDWGPGAEGANSTSSAQDSPGVRLKLDDPQVPPGASANGASTFTAETSRLVEPGLLTDSDCVGDCEAIEADPKSSVVWSLLISGAATALASPANATISGDGVPVLNTLSPPVRAPGAVGEKRTSTEHDAPCAMIIAAAHPPVVPPTSTNSLLFVLMAPNVKLPGPALVMMTLSADDGWPTAVVPGNAVGLGEASRAGTGRLVATPASATLSGLPAAP